MGNRGNITKISLLVLLGTFLIGIGSTSDAFAVTTTDLYTCDKTSAIQISKISEIDGTVISNNTISNISGGTPAFTNPPTRCLGLATDPTDAQMYAIIRDNDFLRYLVTIDPTTGSATMVGFFKLKEIGFTDFIANNIAFDSSGQLFVTESIGGNFSPNEYYKMNKVGASGVVLVDDDGVDGATPECTFISAGDFNLIALNHDDGSQYHILGGGTGEQHKIGKIDITQADCIIGSESNLPAGTSFSMDMTYSTTAGKFFVRHDDAVGGGVPQTLDTVTTGGVLVTIATDTPNVSQRGLAFALNILPPPPAFGNPIHFYALNGTTTDDFGGNSIVLSDGGTGLNATGWNFLEADKATLLSSIDEFEYGIEVVWSFKESSGFRRILDWHDFNGSVANADSDFGLYRASIGLYEFFDNVDPTCGTITANQTSHFLVQRNATSALVELYADGSLCTSFTDSDPEYLFDQATQLITFFKDDGVEDSDGFVDCIAIYDKPMSSADAITTTTNTSACFTASALPTPYTISLLDVFKSSSTTLESGTPVCLDVDLTSASACGSELLTNEIYRFEVEVSNTSGSAESPTSLDFESVVGFADVLGTINANSIIASGCSTNTDWTDSISGGTDVTLTSGTTCSIPASGSVEFWFVTKVVLNADDDTATFTISDGVNSDTSTTTSFTVNTTSPPATSCADENCPEPVQHFPLNCNSCDGLFDGRNANFRDILETGIDDQEILSVSTFTNALNKTGYRSPPITTSGLNFDLALEFEYGIEMIFSYGVFSSNIGVINEAPNPIPPLSGIRNRIINLVGSQSDSGLYASVEKFTFFNNTFSVGGYGSDCGSISNDERIHLFMQRNATSELVELYIDGQLCTSFIDSEPEFLGTSVQLADDSTFVDCVLFYDELFTTAQAQVLTKTSLCPDVPVFNNPSSLYLLNGINSNTLKDSKFFNHLPPLLNHDFGGSTTNTDFDLVLSDQGLGLNGTGWTFLSGAELAIADQQDGQFSAPTTLIGEFNYGIEMVFSFDDSPSFRRVLDWHDFLGSPTNADSEFGLYTDNQREFTFFDNTATVGYGSDCGSTTEDVPVHILVQRNATSELVELYVDGALCTSFTDSEPEFTFDFIPVPTSGERKVTFFRDDGGEGGQGFVECIAIYDGVMSSADAITTTAKFGQCFNGNDAPVTTLIGLSQVEIGLGEDYIELGATCDDPEEGSLAVTIGGDIIDNTKPAFLTVTYDCQDSHSTFALNLSSGLSTDRFGVSGTKFRSIPLEEQDASQLTRLVVVGGGFGQGAGAGGAVGGLIGGFGDGVLPLTEAEQQAIDVAFDQAVQDAIDAIGLTEGNIVETIIQTFFEFIVVDTVHVDIPLNSFLDSERLGVRWSTGDDIVIASATPSASPFMFTFEQFPAIKQGSGAFVSTSFLTYNVVVPTVECTIQVTSDCVQKVRYEIPVTVNAIINGTNVADTGTITIDLTEEPIDPILLIILATFSIPIIGVIVQRIRGRSVVEPIQTTIRRTVG